jgi:hypothetical protein
MHKKHVIRVIAAMIAGAAVAERPARAVELITNGNFETGTLAGWTVSDQAGGSGSFFPDTPGTTAPLSGLTTSPNALGGTTYATTDQTGPGAHVLSQAFTVPAGTTALTLSFQMFVNDYDGGPTVGPLDYSFPSVEFGTVDILKAAASPFSTAAGDVVVNEYQGADLPLGSNPHPYTSYSFNLTGVLTPGTTYQLRFAEADNSGFFTQGVDNVSINATVPEPGSMALLGGAALLSIRRKRR